MTGTNLRTIYRNYRLNHKISINDEKILHGYNPRLRNKQANNASVSNNETNQPRLYKGKPIHRMNY